MSQGAGPAERKQMQVTPAEQHRLAERIADLWLVPYVEPEFARLARAEHKRLRDEEEQKRLREHLDRAAAQAERLIREHGCYDPEHWDANGRAICRSALERTRHDPE